MRSAIESAAIPGKAKIREPFHGLPAATEPAAMIELASMYWPSVGAAAALAGSVLALFIYAEKRLRKDFRERVALWIIDNDQSLPLSNQVTKVMILVFGERVFSKRALIVSSVLPITFSGTMFYIIHRPFGDMIELDTGIPHFTIYEQAFGLTEWLTFLCIVILCNIPADFLSLAQTRMLIVKLQNTSKIWLFIVWLIADIFLTILIFHVFFEIARMPEYTAREEDPDKWGMMDMIAFLIRDNLYVRGNWTILILLTTTFTTSIWLWLYMAAAASGRAIYLLGALVQPAINVLDHEFILKRPLAFIGEIAAALSFIAVIMTVLAFHMLT